MKEELKINSNIIKLTGKAELPHEIMVGENYHISLSGSIPTFSYNDLHDGSWNRVYTFKPIKVELLDPLGKSIVAKDTRSMSQLLRGLIRKKWINAASNIDEEEYYQKIMYGIMSEIDLMIEKYIE